MEGKKEEKIDRYDYHEGTSGGIGKEYEGGYVDYDDHIEIFNSLKAEIINHEQQLGTLIMDNLTLKLENEAYQVHIKEQEDAKNS